MIAIYWPCFLTFTYSFPIWRLQWGFFGLSGSCLVPENWNGWLQSDDSRMMIDLVVWADQRDRHTHRHVAIANSAATHCVEKSYFYVFTFICARTTGCSCKSQWRCKSWEYPRKIWNENIAGLFLHYAWNNIGYWLSFSWSTVCRRCYPAGSCCCRWVVSLCWDCEHEQEEQTVCNAAFFR